MLIGGAGNDFLNGGFGNDVLTGGAGKDAFVFDTKPHKSSNKDAINDFKVVDDTIHLDNAAFTKVGSNGTLKASAFWANTTGKAHDSNDRIIYDKDPASSITMRTVLAKERRWHLRRSRRTSR